MKVLISLLLLTNILVVKAQIYPSFGNEIDVSINGLTFDAMEPFISANGNYLFFNNLNDGIDTKLFYASKINDSTFNFVGELNGTGQLSPTHLDAVADMDASNHFYWTSTRNYPAELDNLFYGNFNSGNVTGIGRVHGNFNKNIPGWLVMDHGISYDGQLLYYNNARLDQNNCQGPCETELGIAQKMNDSTFSQISNSSAILQTINDTNFIYYAPCISSDNLEFYYTRYPRDTITVNTLFEICVAVRSTPTDHFSAPLALFSETIANLIEAPTLTTDKQIMYYHRKIPGSHKIVMRYRENSLAIETNKNESIRIYPNPASRQIGIQTNFNYQKMKVSIFTLLGIEALSVSNQSTIDISALAPGTYTVKLDIDGEVSIQKLIKIE
ncbi:MAG: T9SS type A sorting domain-containing protein [Crocinitomicaceae bacterium]